LEYIECTHCGKRYAVNDKIRESAGDFARCKNCFEKFLLVVRDSDEFGIETQDEGFNATEGWNPTLTVPPPTEQDEAGDDGGWDPSLTMPEENEEDSASYEPSLDDEQMQEKAQETLAAIQAKKKKMLINYVLLGVVLSLLAISLYMLFAPEKNQPVSGLETKAMKRPSVQELDKVNPDCRQAAARQWLLDYKAMHGQYSGKEFVELLHDTEKQSLLVQKLCQNKRLLRTIIAAATHKEKPEWLSKEIETYSRK